MSDEQNKPSPEEQAAKKAFSKLKELSMDEIQKHNNEESPWLLIHGKVYGVKEYMDNHPGGPEILVDNSGKDASEEYDDIGHSDDATAEMEKYLVGRLKGATLDSLKKSGGSSGGGGGASLILVLLIPVLLAFLYYQFVVLAEEQ